MKPKWSLLAISAVAFLGVPKISLRPFAAGPLGPAPRLVPVLSRPLALPISLTPVPAVRQALPVPAERTPIEAARGFGAEGFERLMAMPAASFKAHAAKGNGRGSSRGSRRGIPDAEPEPSRNSEDISDLDELGNPRRRQSDGPDTVSDEPSGGRDNSPLF